MKLSRSLALVPLAMFLTSCATPQPPQVFYNTDRSALVIDSLDTRTCRQIQPTVSSPESNDKILGQAKTLPQRQTAVVILENYTEPQVGEQFRDRGTALFVALRTLGYQHIVFLQGRGVPDPDGLLTVAEYE